MVNLMTVVADGAGRWDTGIPLHMAIDTALAHLFRTLARSPFLTRFPARTPFRSAILFLVYFGGLLRLAFYFFFFPQHRRFRSTSLIFISFPISGI